MYIYEKYDYSLFESRFKDYGRLDQFSYAGLKSLYNYLIETAEATGEPIELDVIALCCDYSEFTLEEAKEQYGEDYEDYIVIYNDEQSVICTG